MKQRVLWPWLICVPQVHWKACLNSTLVKSLAAHTPAFLGDEGSDCQCARREVPSVVKRHELLDVCIWISAGRVCTA